MCVCVCYIEYSVCVVVGCWLLVLLSVDGCCCFLLYYWCCWCRRSLPQKREFGGGPLPGTVVVVVPYTKEREIHSRYTDSTQKHAHSLSLLRQCSSTAYDVVYFME